MSINLASTKTISRTACCYRIKAVTMSFYQDGSTMAACAISVVGVFGNESEGVFTAMPAPEGEFSAVIKDSDAITWLQALIQAGEVGQPRLDMFIAWLDAKLKAMGVV